MLTACWSTKGGVGTTVVATCLALLLGARNPGGAVVADLCGDVPAVLGLDEVASPGLAGWLSAGAGVPADALGRLQVGVVKDVVLLPRGVGALAADRAPVLAGLLDRSPRPVVADCGRGTEAAHAAIVAGSSRSLLVTRTCFVALRLAAEARMRPSGVVVVREAGRRIRTKDVEDAAKAPVVAEIDCDPGVARAVDAGLLAGARLPRTIVRGLRHAL